VVAGLIAGDFQYRPTGLLDETHLRFFTRASLLDLLRKHSFHAGSIKALHLPVHLSEFRERAPEALSAAVLRALLAHPDALAYRPGFVHLHALSLHDAAGAAFWSWDGLLGSLRSPREMRVLAGPLAGALLCAGNDPSVELPLPAEALARLREGGTVRLEMSW